MLSVTSSSLVPSALQSQLRKQERMRKKTLQSRIKSRWARTLSFIGFITHKTYLNLLYPLLLQEQPIKVSEVGTLAQQ